MRLDGGGTFLRAQQSDIVSEHYLQCWGEQLSPNGGQVMIQPAAVLSSNVANPGGGGGGGHQ